jgi:lipoyl(octanoyl) transferase
MSIEIKISKRRIPYKKAINILKNRVNLIKSGKAKDLLWILEHPTVYTAGIRSVDKEILDKRIKIVKTDRGGKITLHNAGQKIIYFAIDLNNKKKDIRNLVTVIENIIIQFLKQYNLKSNSDKKKIGIWIKERKIAAIGIKVSKWIAYHGCSININNDLNKYKKIIPCGLDNEQITSLKEEGINNFTNINKNLIKIFLKNYKKI